MKLLLSQVKALPFDLDAEVEKHIAALKKHQSSEGEAAPGAIHPLIEHCIKRVQYPAAAGKADDFVAIHQIEDDTPSLAARKAAMAHQLQIKAHALIEEIWPPLKRRLAMIRFNEAAGVPKEKRTAAQQKVIADHVATSNRIDGINRHLAVLEDQIHDLTEETFEAWKPAPFPAA